MKTVKFWLAVVTVWIAANILNIGMGGLWAGMMKMTDILDTSTKPLWYILGNFVSAFVFVAVYQRVFNSFGGGMIGGLKYGVYAGLLLNFPTWLIVHLMFKNFPLELAAVWTAVGFVSCAVWGLVLGAVYRRS
jgi:hypothetical protein